MRGGADGYDVRGKMVSGNCNKIFFLAPRFQTPFHDPHLFSQFLIPCNEAFNLFYPQADRHRLPLKMQGYF
jgi:hypothetical protein